MTEPLLSVRGLSKSFETARRGFAKPPRVKAVQDVSFDVEPAKTVALVGESGSGKTTTARLVLRLVEPDAGSVSFDGVDWLALDRTSLNRRRKDLSVVFQDPATSLNPRMTVFDIVSEPLAIHGLYPGKERREKVRELLLSVGLPDSAAEKTPREFSGGQRQRIGIARALSTSPRFVVLDEPVSALDVSVRAQILNLLRDLQEETPSHPAYLFIGHDLQVVREIADRTAVMYLGRIVEEGPTAGLFEAPRHPYTSLLLASQPRETPDEPKSRAIPQGEPPSPASPPPGCAFHPRCPSARARCRDERPEERVEGDRRVACFFPNG